MARNDYFAPFKETTLSGASGTARRIGHSFSNYFQSIDRTTFGVEEGKNPLKDGRSAFGAGELRNAAAAAASTGGTLLGTGGMAAGVVTLAAASLATAATIAALAGPQAAIVGGVLGIALVAKSTYSNRESAHVELTKFCWSLIDDESPRESFLTVSKLNDASSAALTLMEDGKSQIKLLASKLAAAKTKLDALHEALQANETAIGNLPVRTSGQASADTLAKIKALKEKNEKLIEDAKKPKGAIYEYARRIVHTGNYIQAPHVIALAMKEKHSPGSVVGVGQTDYFANTALGTNTRQFFTLLATVYTEIVTPPSGHRAGGAAIRQAVQTPRTMPTAPAVVRSRP